MNQSTKDSTKGVSFYKNISIYSTPGKHEPEGFSESRAEEITDKLHEAQLIVGNAKETLKRMSDQEISLKRQQIENQTIDSSNRLADILFLSCEMRQGLRTMEKEVKELKSVAWELLNPGYYRRNQYPHSWRLSRKH